VAALFTHKHPIVSFPHQFEVPILNAIWTPDGVCQGSPLQIQDVSVDSAEGEGRLKPNKFYSCMFVKVKATKFSEMRFRKRNGVLFGYTVCAVSNISVLLAGVSFCSTTPNTHVVAPTVMADYTIQIVAKITPDVDERELRDTLNLPIVRKRLGAVLEGLYPIPYATEPTINFVITAVTVV
jgi:hypothetical protein